MFLFLHPLYRKKIGNEQTGLSDGMGREFTYLSSHATNRYFIPNWCKNNDFCLNIQQFFAKCRWGRHKKKGRYESLAPAFQRIMLSHVGFH